MQQRRIATPEEFFDILNDLRNNSFVSIGYTVDSPLDLPKVKRKNPLTNRMKGYDDFSVFPDEGIVGIIQITSYNLRWRHDFGDQYNKYKNGLNGINAEYGLPPIGDKETTYDNEKSQYGKTTISQYTGNNDALKGHSYQSQNTFGHTPTSVVYLVDSEGHLSRGLSKEEVKPYLKKARAIGSSSALQKLGADDATIQSYIEKVKGLKFKFGRFILDSILWMCATVTHEDGTKERILYLNSAINKCVDDVRVNPEDFMKVAKERFNKDLATHESITRTGKNLIRLTESDLHRIIKESVRRILKEDRYKYKW